MRYERFLHGSWPCLYREQRRESLSLGRSAFTSCIDRCCVDGIGQNATHRRQTPGVLAFRSWDAQLRQVLSQVVQSMSLPQIVGKHLGHMGRFDFLQTDSSWIAWMIRVKSIAIGWPTPRQHRARSKFLQATSAHPFSDEAAFILGDSSPNLQE